MSGRARLRHLLISGLPLRYFWPRARTPFSFVRDVLGGADIRAVDIGARGDIPPHWLVLDGVAEIAAIEPDARAAEALKATYAARGHPDKYRVLPFAVSGTGGPRTLYVPEEEGGASVLPFFNRPFREYTDLLAKPPREVALQTQTLSQALRGTFDDAHLIKLDIQGVELEVLQSLSAPEFDAFLAVEAEVCMQEGAERPVFRELDAFMVERGFELYDLRCHRTYRTDGAGLSSYNVNVFGVHDRSPTIAPRIWECDALYFRPVPEVLAARDERTVRRMIVALCTYNYFAEAYALAEDAQNAGILGAADVETVKRSIVDWHRVLRYHWLHGNNRVAAVVRKLAKFLRLGDQLRWIRVAWVGYPSS
jgi:FkbM family methyltransferase